MERIRCDMHGLSLATLALGVCLTSGCAATALVAGEESESRSTVSVGYGEIDQKNLTTAVSVLTEEEISRVNASSVEELLMGRRSGHQYAERLIRPDPRGEFPLRQQ